MPTADSGETAPTSGGETRPTGSTGGDTGNQQPSPNAGLTREDLTKALSDAIKPFQQRIDELEGRLESGSHPAARRVAAKRRAENQPGNDDGDDDSDDPKTGELRREVAALREANTRREAAERKARIDKALDAELDAKKVANRDVLEGLLIGKLREGESGAILYDDGTRAVPLADAVKQYADRDIFKPASSGDGTGTRSGDRLPQGGRATEFTPEAIAKMTPQQRAQISARMQAGEDFSVPPKSE